MTKDGTIITQNLVEMKDGICLASPHAKKIWLGEKTLIIKSKLFRGEVNKLLYLLEDGLCYGIIRLKYPSKISLQEFKELEKKHLMSGVERKKWWPYKEILYAYNFDVITFYKEPRRVEFPMGSKTFVKEFDLLDVKEQFINDISNYSSGDVDDKQLADDWKIVMAWYSTKKSGGKIKHSVEEITCLASKIYKEIVSRVDAGRMKHDFELENMAPLSKELYVLVSGGVDHIKNSGNRVNLSDPGVLEEFEDKIVVKDFISVVGNAAECKDFSDSDSVDLLVRLSNPSLFLKNAVESRISKKLEFSDNLNFVWGDSGSQHDTFIPLYDLKLSRIVPLNRVKLQSEVIKPGFTLFKPMNPEKEFYKSTEVLDYMFENGKKYALEKNFVGVRALLIKNGQSVRVYSCEKVDISKHFKNITAEATQLSSKNFILDCEITCNGGIDKIVDHISGKECLDESMILFNVVDCVSFGEDLSDKPWPERKTVIHSLNFTKHIKEASSVIVDNREDAGKVIKLLGNLNNSCGAMIKNYFGKYFKDVKSDAWVSFKNKADAGATSKTDKVLESTTTKTDGVNKVAGIEEGKEVPSSDGQGEEDKDAADWDEKKLDDTTSSTPRISDIQGKSFPKKKREPKKNKVKIIANSKTKT